METERKEQSRNLTDFSNAPFIFYLKDGTELGLDDWTVYSEKWAKKTFGSMEEFNRVLFQSLSNPNATEADMDAAIEASFMVAAHQLDDNSRRIVDERRPEEMTTEEFLARNMGTKILNKLCDAIVEMFRDSLPPGWEEAYKKKLATQAARKPMPPTRRR